MGNAIIVEPYDLGTVQAEGSAAGTVPGNMNNDWMGVVHRGTATTPPGAVDSFRAAQGPVDVVALLSCNGAVTNFDVLGGSFRTSGDLYTGASLTFPAGATTPTSGRTNALHLLPSPVTAPYWMAKFNVMTGVAFECGRFVLGRKYQPVRNFSFGASFGALDRGGGDFNTQGVWLPKPGAQHRTVGLSFSATTRQEAEATLMPLLERVGNRKHVLLITDPDVNDLRQRRMYFGPFVGNLDMLWRTPDGWEWRANLVSTI